MKIEEMFDEITLLRQRLSVDGRLEVTHAGHLWAASFEWFSPASTEVIEATERKLSKSLPKDYVAFLSHITNGALMFHDFQGSQWGFRIYGTGELLEKQSSWQYSLESDWKPQFVAFAENLGDEYVMLFDLERPTSDTMSCAVLQGSPYDPVDYWPIASRSFHEWLDHLVTAQGDKYWEWR